MYNVQQKSLFRYEKFHYLGLNKLLNNNEYENGTG